LGDVERKWFADQIVIILRQHLSELQRQKFLFEECLCFFCKYGFFVGGSLSKLDQSMLREKLFSLLSMLIADTTEVWSTYAVLRIETLEEDHKKTVKLDSEIKKIRKAGIKTMKKLQSMVCPLRKTNLCQRMRKGSQQHRGMEMLFGLSLLQLYNGDTEAVSVLQVFWIVTTFNDVGTAIML
jgi:DNA polymerase phi